MKRWSLVLLAALSAVAAVAAGPGGDSHPLTETFVNWTEHPAIRYESGATTDPVAEFNRKLQSGQAELRRDGPAGYLRAVLDVLQVSTDTQMLVFEKDSVQARRISAGNPRSLFFNDSVAVGWVRGGFIELASQDPRQGVVFYMLDQSFLGPPSFVRPDTRNCLVCHHNFASGGVPGMLVRSARQFSVTHSVPFEKRWGGWYVTGDHGTFHHLGNTDLQHLYDEPPPSGTSNWASLAGKFDTSGYLTEQSDIVALTVFEHQMHMMNLLTRMGWEARVIEYRRTVPEAQRKAEGDDPSDKTVSMDEAAKEVVDYMLFTDEAPLPQPIHGPTTFAERFSGLGPKDRKGRSLRQLDLTRRLLRYPCSYMIYSSQFEQLPGSAKTAVYNRLWTVLSGKDRHPKYASLTAADRTAIVDILRDTKPDLPKTFKPLGTHAAH
ncbi:MAG TPA: hypothetical protein VFP91_06070 [Vicinamibacterales bacterium]|nr:hypothetical protein [Vicinamibacterales bacterium]